MYKTEDWRNRRKITETLNLKERTHQQENQTEGKSERRNKVRKVAYLKKANETKKLMVCGAAFVFDFFDSASNWVLLP